VNSTYELAIGEWSGSHWGEVFVQMWRMKLPPKISFLLWRAMGNRLSMGENMRKGIYRYKTWIILALYLESLKKLQIMPCCLVRRY